MRIRGVLVLLLTLVVVLGTMSLVSLSLTGKIVEAGTEGADTAVVDASRAVLRSGEQKTDDAATGADECDATFRRIYGPSADCTPQETREGDEFFDTFITIQEEHDAAFATGEYANATDGVILRIEKLLQSSLGERERGEAEAYLAQLYREKAAQLVEETETFDAAMSELEKAGELYERAAASFTSAGFSDAGESAEILAGNTFLAMVELFPAQFAENLAKAEAAYQQVLAGQKKERDPRVSAAAVGLAQAAITRGDLDAAMTFLDTAEQYDASNPNTRRLRKAIVQGSTISALTAIKDGYFQSTQKDLKAFEKYWSLDSPVMGVLQQMLETGTVIHAKLRNDASKSLDQLIQGKSDESNRMVVALTFIEGLVRRGYTMQDIYAMSYEQRKDALRSMHETLREKRAGEIAFAIGTSFENGDVAKLTRLGDQAHRFFKNAPTLDYTDNTVQSVVDEIAVGRSVYNVPNVLAASFAGAGAGQILSYSYARAGFTFVTRASTDKALAYGFGVGFVEGQIYSQGIIIGSSYAGKAAVAAGAPEWVANDLHGAGDILSNVVTFSPLSARITKWAGGKAVDLKLEEKSQYLLGEKTLYEGVKAKTAREQAKIERELLNQRWEKIANSENPDIVLLRPRLEPAPGGSIPAQRPPLVVYHGEPPSRIRGETIWGETTPQQLHEYVTREGQTTLRETLATRPMTVQNNRVHYATSPAENIISSALDSARTATTNEQKIQSLEMLSQAENYLASQESLMLLGRVDTFVELRTLQEKLGDELAEQVGQLTDEQFNRVLYLDSIASRVFAERQLLPLAEVWTSQFVASEGANLEVIAEKILAIKAEDITGDYGIKVGEIRGLPVHLLRGDEAISLSVREQAQGIPAAFYVASKESLTDHVKLHNQFPSAIYILKDRAAKIAFIPTFGETQSRLVQRRLYHEFQHHAFAQLPDDFKALLEKNMKGVPNFGTLAVTKLVGYSPRYRAEELTIVAFESMSAERARAHDVFDYNENQLDKLMTPLDIRNIRDVFYKTIDEYVDVHVQELANHKVFDALANGDGKIVLPGELWAPVKIDGETLVVWSDAVTRRTLVGYGTEKGIDLEQLLNGDTAAVDAFKEHLFSKIPPDKPVFIGESTFRFRGKSLEVLLEGIPKEPYFFRDVALPLPGGTVARDIRFDRGGHTHIEGGWIHVIFRHVNPDPEVHRAAIIFSQKPAGLFVKKDRGKIIPYTALEVKALIEESLSSSDLKLSKDVFKSKYDSSTVYELESLSNNLHITLTEKNGLLRFNSAYLSEKPVGISNNEWRKIQSQSEGRYTYVDGELVFRFIIMFL